MKTSAEMLACMIGRAMRAHAESMSDLPKSQRDFHAGRREAYLQMVAQLCDTEVKNIRADVLGSEGARESTARPNLRTIARHVRETSQTYPTLPY